MLVEKNNCYSTNIFILEKWSKDAEGREEFESFYRADNYQRAREAHRQQRHDFQTETTEQRYRRAQRVQENINKVNNFFKELFFYLLGLSISISRRAETWDGGKIYVSN